MACGSPTPLLFLVYFGGFSVGGGRGCPKGIKNLAVKVWGGVSVNGGGVQVLQKYLGGAVSLQGIGEWGWGGCEPPAALSANQAAPACPSTAVFSI